MFMAQCKGKCGELDNGLCLWHNARESAESGGTITFIKRHGTDNLANIMDHIGETYHL